LSKPASLDSAAMADAAWTIPLSDLAVDDELLAAAHEALASGWWTMGPRVEELETAFAEYCGIEHALAVANGTAALHIALLALDVGPGDEVVVPSLNFVAAANVIRHVGATPVFCDVRGASDLNLDPADVEAALTPQTKVILVIHYAGFPCDMAAMTELAGRAGAQILEDAAHAPGAMYRGRKCGAIGAIGCFSFFSNKNLPVGEGGMVVTGDDELAARLRLLRSHGMTTLTWDRHRGHAHSYDVVSPGFNYRLDEVRAAIGLVQLRRLEDANAKRAALAARYRELLDGQDGIVVPFDDLDGDVSSSHHIEVVVLPEGAERTEIQAMMRERGVQTSVHYPPIHQFSAYASEPGARVLPQTEALAGRVLTLPLYAHMPPEDVDTVAQALLDALRG
jgi:dTDP-4-amino-4,6-dideoxygalactose transaminase